MNITELQQDIYDVIVKHVGENFEGGNLEVLFTTPDNKIGFHTKESETIMVIRVQDIVVSDI